MYSAIKHQGKPLYVLARKGIEIERTPRSIKIFSLTIDHYDNDLLTFQVSCSKGTYIRTLVEEIGRELGCGAHVIQLRRTMVTPYGSTPMHTLSSLELLSETAGFSGLLTSLLPVETAVSVLPAVKLSTSATFYLRMGQSVRWLDCPARR